MFRTTLMISLTTLALANPAALGRIDWIQQSPYPADVDLHAVWFVTPDHGFISGADDLLMETFDGGVTWSQTSSVARSPQFFEDPIWDIQFVDDQHGFAAGNTIFRTTDGGATWQDLGSVGSIYDLAFITPEVGYLRSNLYVMRTDNGGDTWTMVWDWETFDPVSAIDFIDENHGLLVGARDDVPGVFETTNGGGSWNRISGEAFGNVLHVTPDIVVATRLTGFYRSTDGGHTWALMHEEPGPLVNSIETVRLIPGTENSIAAIDINARIWISPDGGVTWTRTFGPLGNWGYEWDIRFADASTGYAVGRLGMIYKTTDGGQTWTQLNHGAAAALNDIIMLPSGLGIAVGAQGVVLRTDDFGRNWILRPQVAVGVYAVDLETVESIDGETIVAAGSGFARSDDGGVTWTANWALPGHANDLSFLDVDNGWAFGELSAPWGYIAQTTDGGATWARIPDGELFPPAHEGKIMPSGRGWSLFSQTEQAISDDAFEVSYVPRSLPSGDSWQEFDFATDDVGWYGGFFGGVLRSDTGGYIFEAQELPDFRYGSGAATDRLTDVVAISTQEAYISILKQGAIYDGVVYRTMNGGATWVPLDPIRSTTNQTGGAVSEIAVVPAAGGTDMPSIWGMSGNGFIFASDEPTTSVPGDVTGDGVVDFTDLLSLLAAWGPCPPPPAACPADFNGNGAVDFADLLVLLAAWS